MEKPRIDLHKQTAQDVYDELLSRVVMDSKTVVTFAQKIFNDLAEKTPQDLLFLTEFNPDILLNYLEELKVHFKSFVNFDTREEVVVLQSPKWYSEDRFY